MIPEFNDSYKFPFDKCMDIVRLLDKKGGVYCYSCNDTPIYIGKSVDIGLRLRQHNTKMKRLSEEYGINCFNVRLMANKGNIGAAESRLIRKYNPRLNGIKYSTVFTPKTIIGLVTEEQYKWVSKMSTECGVTISDFVYWMVEKTKRGIEASGKMPIVTNPYRDPLYDYEQIENL